MIKVFYSLNFAFFRVLYLYIHVSVVTGCCRGIGMAYVEELASSGLNVVLLTSANREEEMDELAKKVGLYK